MLIPVRRGEILRCAQNDIGFQATGSGSGLKAPGLPNAVMLNAVKQLDSLLWKLIPVRRVEIRRCAQNDIGFQATGIRRGLKISEPPNAVMLNAVKHPDSLFWRPIPDRRGEILRCAQNDIGFQPASSGGGRVSEGVSDFMELCYC